MGTVQGRKPRNRPSTRSGASKGRPRGSLAASGAARAATRKAAPKRPARRSDSRTSRPAAARGASGRAAVRRPAPDAGDLDGADAAAVATLDLGNGTPSYRADGLRMQPSFPTDDYDYTYLQDFLALDDVPRDCRAVVFGCGKGEEAVFFSERRYRVTGIDSDRNSIGLARERAWLNSRDIDFMIGDVFESANLLPAESFGLASDRGVFRGIKGERERRRYLELVRRLLLPGGVFRLSATTVDTGKKAKTGRRRRKGQSHLLVQEGGEVMGEIIRAGLTISGRKLYPIPGESGRAELQLYCRR